MLNAILVYLYALSPVQCISSLSQGLMQLYSWHLTRLLHVVVFQVRSSVIMEPISPARKPGCKRFTSTPRFIITRSHPPHHWAGSHGIRWHFSPARTPHFGGLWEAGVRSIKSLLRNVMSSQILSLEVFTTVLADVEASLNSRLIGAATVPTEDGESLFSPRHFLIGHALKALHTINPINIKIHASRRWNLVQHLIQEILERWTVEYLQQLMRVGKWYRADQPHKINDVVLIKDTDQLQRNWPMGRVIATYPGEDGDVRVVDILSNGRTYRRGVRTLVLVVDGATAGENVHASSPQP